MFKGQFGEPFHEDYTLPDGRTVKVYPVDVHDDLLPVLLGILWECPTGYLNDEESISDLYLNFVKKQACMSYQGWKNLLRYYGFMEERDPTLPPSPRDVPPLDHSW
jgi:hypothetical protein